MPSITMTEDEYEALKKRIRDAEDRAAGVARQLEAEQVKTRDEVYMMLAVAYDNAKVCVDFMVANLHPEFIKDMPWPELDSLADMVAQVGGNGERDNERAMIWKEHVRIIKKFELERQLRGKDPEPGTFRRDRPE